MYGNKNLFVYTYLSKTFIFIHQSPVITASAGAYPNFTFGGRNSAGYSPNHQLLIINLALVPGRQLVNSATAQSPGRWWQF
jgi:hypothetical protein